jgi:hypothetical protein
MNNQPTGVSVHCEDVRLAELTQVRVYWLASALMVPALSSKLDVVVTLFKTNKTGSVRMTKH